MEPSRRARWTRLAHALARRVIVSALVAGVAPVVTYIVVRPHVQSTAVALAITFAVPVVWAGLSGLWHWRLDLDGILTIGAYGLGLVVTILSGGSALPLKLHSAAETAAVGVACLVSVVFRRPLLLVGLRILARQRRRRRGAWRKAFAEPALRHTFSVITILVGVGLLVEAASQVALALALPTIVFVAVSLPVRFAIYGGGAGLFFAFRGRGMPWAARTEPVDLPAGGAV
ncbi:MAG TPA: VC0807 family protein [Acidimicrobiales bacterium]|nr:VC0807 family protein [Acidimicrobiales bacterium]